MQGPPGKLLVHDPSASIARCPASTACFTPRTRTTAHVVMRSRSALFPGAYHMVTHAHLTSLHGCRADNGLQNTYLLEAGPQDITMSYKLPAGLTCEGGCVLQWVYKVSTDCIPMAGNLLKLGPAWGGQAHGLPDSMHLVHLWLPCHCIRNHVRQPIMQAPPFCFTPASYRPLTASPLCADTPSHGPGP
jgi:hypothetical protein